MLKFEVGDKVRQIDPEVYYYGLEGTVTMVYNGNESFCRYYVDFGVDVWWCIEKTLMLVRDHHNRNGANEVASLQGANT